MSLPDDVRALAGQILPRLDESRDFYLHTKEGLAAARARAACSAAPRAPWESQSSTETRRRSGC